MTEFAKAPKITHTASGVYVHGVGLLDEQTAAKTLRWLGSALAKHRRRKAAAGTAPVVTVDGGLLRVGGLTITADVALKLADALVDAVEGVRSE